MQGRSSCNIWSRKYIELTAAPECTVNCSCYELPELHRHPQQASSATALSSQERFVSGLSCASASQHCSVGLSSVWCFSTLKLSADSFSSCQTQTSVLLGNSHQQTAPIPCVQAEWHHKKFSRLQHLQSPARLIRELVKPRRMVVDTP